MTISHKNVIDSNSYHWLIITRFPFYLHVQLVWIPLHVKLTIWIWSLTLIWLIYCLVAIPSMGQLLTPLQWPLSPRGKSIWLNATHFLLFIIGNIGLLIVATSQHFWISVYIYVENPYAILLFICKWTNWLPFCSQLFKYLNKISIICDCKYLIDKTINT